MIGFTVVVRAWGRGGHVTRPPASSWPTRGLPRAGVAAWTRVLLCVARLAACCALQRMRCSSRGHVFGFAFGAAGSGDGQFEGPTQVAVDEATGEVYVVDSGGERVEVFKPEAGGGYEYVSQFKVHSPGR